MKKPGDISLNKKNIAPIKFLIGAICLSLLIFALNFFNSGIKNVFYFFTSPLEKAFWSAGAASSEYLKSFGISGSLAKENENLKTENQKLLSEILALRAITDGNRAQSDVSLSCQNNGFELLMAGIVGLDGQDMLSINKGSADGVREGMPVISQQGVLFGKVFNVYKNFSNVMLISNKNSTINVKIPQQDIAAPEISGIIKGKGGLAVYLDLIPVDDTINQGELVVTSALEGAFPKDLLVGKITKVEKNDQNPHQSAEVNAFFDFSIDNLFVITNYKQEK